MIHQEHSLLTLSQVSLYSWRNWQPKRAYDLPEVTVLTRSKLELGVRSFKFQPQVLSVEKIFNMWIRNLIDYISYINVFLVNIYSFKNNLGNILSNKFSFFEYRLWVPTWEFPLPHVAIRRKDEEIKEEKGSEMRGKKWMKSNMWSNQLSTPNLPKPWFFPTNCKNTFNFHQFWNGAIYIYLKIENFIFLNAICSNMDGPRDYHTKWSKSERERQIYDITYMWNLNMREMNLFTKQKQTYRHRKQTFLWYGGYQRGKRVGKNKIGVWD